MDIGADRIREWHINQRGWRDIGYHFVLRRDGTIEKGRPVGEVGAHVAGHNTESLGICLVGGVTAHGEPEANYTDTQLEALDTLLRSLLRDYPEARVLGHRDFEGVTKACPCFDVRAWWQGRNHIGPCQSR
jgi:N-acetyl-anhydromuramyl-L-alanine amidase AmpD